MSEPREADEQAAEDTAGILHDLVYELDSDRVAAILEALELGQDARVRGLVASLHSADMADLLERLSPQERARLIAVARNDLMADVLVEVDESIREEIIEQLSTAEVAAAVVELDSDDAVNLVEELDEDDRREILDAIPDSDRLLIEEALSFPEDSAGRMMQREVMVVPSFWTVGETIDFMRRSADEEDGGSLPEMFYDIFVVDPAHHPVGAISLSRLLRTRRPVTVTDIMSTEMHVIPGEMDQEEVAFLFRQRDLVSAPVVNQSGRLVGAITIDDVVDVIHEEHEEDIMRLGGVVEDDLYSAIFETTRLRFSWLALNLATAIAASMVIGLFEDTIEKIVALAVLMPIVASMGGNAGTQTLTVAVRALATKQLTATNAMRLVGKEFLVGGFNGMLFAVLAGVITWIWFGDPDLGLVIGTAMIANLVVAGLAGATIPIVLDRFGVDPAVASTVFLTTITDIVGFFVFLALAAWVLL